jgi:S-adenosylmethionine:tRNA ribosyltransferase-isomerase
VKTSDYDYHLPVECVAQTPVTPRDSSRLLVYRRLEKTLEHGNFSMLPEYLTTGDVLVLNQTRVLHGRLLGRKQPGNGKVEVLLLKKLGGETWEVLVGGKGLKPGVVVVFSNGLFLEVVEDTGGASRIVSFNQPVEQYLPEFGQVPLPPYIHEKLNDPERYQTVYSRILGSAAAPTAGLHFTPELLTKVKEKGVEVVYVTLHVGLDTFAPITEVNPEDHAIHKEWRCVPTEVANTINRARARGKKIVAVGTTSVRTLESATGRNMTRVQSKHVQGPTDLFILPGFRFQIVDGLLTNFHLPRSTLIMLVDAFIGNKKILDIYKLAIILGYRFYSFGDAMLIL